MIDTRSKIVCAQQARSSGGRPVLWVRARFDPLTAGHVRRLESVARPGRMLAVWLVAAERPLLPARARAELAAGLAIVDFVAIADGSECPGECVDLEDAAIADEFMERVRRRYSAKES